MLVSFFDESYPQGMAKYSVAAVVMDMAALFDLNQGIRGVISYANQAFNVPIGAELHAHEMMQGRGDWKCLAGKHRAIEKIYRKALTVVVDSGAKVFIEGVDVNRLKQRYTYPRDPHQITLTHNLERINDYARSIDRKILVVADEVPSQDQHAASVAMYSVVGTPGYRSSNLAQIVHPVRFDDSRLHIGLQVADLVAYLYNRRVCVVEKDARAEASKQRLWDAVLPAVSHQRMWVP